MLSCLGEVSCLKVLWLVVRGGMFARLFSVGRQSETVVTHPVGMARSIVLVSCHAGHLSFAGMLVF